ncbi:hypothetical protein XELAEV_18002441mg [Xenopus laevis]|uniref:Uncharacterized protein n=1 Tax=Xenopus laevis TaxID=8355 RepID=A0A974GYU6_XENLA|nr:hypothetical protein XELAEV_18002441mg [Xenopus laevis]
MGYFTKVELTAALLIRTSMALGFVQQMNCPLNLQTLLFIALGICESGWNTQCQSTLTPPKCPLIGCPTSLFIIIIAYGAPEMFC